jgi:hypothetical protein
VGNALPQQAEALCFPDLDMLQLIGNLVGLEHFPELSMLGFCLYTFVE